MDQIREIVKSSQLEIEANKNRLIRQEVLVESNTKSILKNQKNYENFDKSFFKFHVETKTGNFTIYYYYYILA
jgi:hypothetical protein